MVITLLQQIAEMLTVDCCKTHTSEDYSTVVKF